jgi:four helix bundle protein
MPPVLSFRDLEVWQASMDLVVEIYRASRGFPVEEKYGLTSQLRRAGVSVPSNIAEGHARKGDGAFLNHVRIALGSLAEVATQLEVATRLEYLDAKQSLGLFCEVDRSRQMLHGLRRSLERKRAGLVSSAILGWLLGAASLIS